MSDHHDRELAQDREMVASTKNTARYFTEHTQVAWVVLVLSLCRVYGYLKMPKGRTRTFDPDAVARHLDGAEAKDEQLARVEGRSRRGSRVEKIESIAGRRGDRLSAAAQGRRSDQGME